MQFLFLLSEMSKGKLNFRTVTSSLLFLIVIRCRSEGQGRKQRFECR